MDRDHNLIAPIQLGERVDFVEFFHLMEAIDADPVSEAVELIEEFKKAKSES